MTKKILIVHPKSDHYANALRAECPQTNIVSLREDALGTRILPEAAQAHLADADAIVSIGRWITPEIVNACANLKWFQCLISGTDHLNELLQGRRITLTNGHGIQGSQMSELAMLHMMAHMRQVPRLVRSQADHKWDQVLPRILRERTVVILGVGLIAEQLAKLCKAFGMNTVGVSRTVREIDGFDRIEPRENLLPSVGEADFVVVLLPLTQQSRGTVGKEVLAAMKPEAGLINIARGGVVDEEALVDALKAGEIAFAGLDVFQTTPLPQQSPLWDMDNVFITSHIGGRSDRYDDDALQFVVPNVKNFVHDRLDQLINVVPL